MRIGGLLCTVLLACTAPALAQPVNSLQLDLQDPAIVEVRDIWRSLQDASAAGALTSEVVTDPCFDATRWRDQTGRVRIYIYAGGTGDSFYTVRQYYDTQHRLRFIHVSAGAVGDASLENRVWIGEHGDVLRDDFRSEGQWAFVDFGAPKYWTLDPEILPVSECGQ